jgi:hypothetical protein
MDIETRFIRAMAQAIDDHFLRGGPYPDDTAILAIAPELAGLLASPEELKDEEEGGLEWIPVSERLPEIGRRVLGFWLSHRGAVQSVRGAIGGWLDDDGRPTAPPTHWMPLPEPPASA